MKFALATITATLSLLSSSALGRPTRPRLNLNRALTLPGIPTLPISVPALTCALSQENANCLAGAAGSAECCRQPIFDNPGLVPEAEAEAACAAQYANDVVVCGTYASKTPLSGGCAGTVGSASYEECCHDLYSVLKAGLQTSACVPAGMVQQ